MRKLILKDTTLKSPIHIGFFRFALSSHYTIFSVEFLPCCRLEPIYFDDIKDWHVTVNFIILLNIQVFWFPAGQGSKK